MAKNNNRTGSLGFESRLWDAADLLRSNMDPSEYKHVVLGLIFLKYIEDAFEARKQVLTDMVCEPTGEYYVEGHEDQQLELTELFDDRDEFVSENVFWVPPEARWSYIRAHAKQPDIGKIIDNAMDAIERENPTLKGVLPKIYAMPGLNKHNLGKLIDLISGIGLGSAEHQARDTLGRVYEYFLSKFASAEGKGGGEFYTPSSIVRVLVAMLEPYSGRVFDPCCGSGGMFVQSLKFIQAHNGKRDAVTVYGQEMNHTTWRMARMNLAIRGIEAKLGKKHADSFHEDLHPDLRADFILANPPFNISEWGGERLRDDVRWKYGVPPKGNANFAWVQHFIHHLSPSGTAGFVLANGSMSSMTSGEGEIRKRLVEADLVDCIVALPGQLFYATQIPVCLWFIARNKSGQPSPPAPLPEVEGRKHYRSGFDFSGLVKTARELRQRQTPAEDVFWAIVRNKGFLNLKFRRQHQIGDYVVDFYCAEKKLVIELDGSVHDASERKLKDQRRDAYLSSLGLKVLRFPNAQLLNNTRDVLNQIANHCVTDSPSPSGRGVGVRVNRLRDRRGEVLFIDARKLGRMETRVHKVLDDADIEKIAGTYHNWRTFLPPSTSGRGAGGEGSQIRRGAGGEGTQAASEARQHAYEDVPGFCKASTLDEIKSHDFVLTPGRYVGAEAVEDDGEPFEEKMARLTDQLGEQMQQGRELDTQIRKQLASIGFEV